MIKQPSMQHWTEAWHNSDSKKLQDIYAKNALIFPPNKPSIQGNKNIIDFMCGGLGKVDVIFEPDANALTMDTKLAFEYGLFKDVEIDSKKILGTGRYSITWLMEDNQWKILCHTWSMPKKD